MNNQTVPLAMAAPGEVVTVNANSAGRGLPRTRADMGLTPGVRVRVINSQMAGPVLIDLRGSRVALGRGIAQKIAVAKV